MKRIQKIKFSDFASWNCKVTEFHYGKGWEKMDIKNKNIVVLFADDQRFDTIHALGNENIITPNLDRLVKMGTSFTNAHIPCGTAPAVCMPSRAMLNSGRTLFHLEDKGQNIPKEHTTLGEHLKTHHYEAFGTGKWHNGTESYTRSFTQGKSVYFGGMWDHWNIPACDYHADGVYGQRKVCNSQNSSNEITVDHGEYMELGKHSTDIFGDRAMEFLDSYQGEDPYFMYVAFMAPHDPRTMPEKYLEMYKDVEVTLPDNFKEEHTFDYGIKYVRDEVLAPYPRTKENTLQQLKEYYAMITHLDEQVGRVLDKLEERGDLENTLIIYTGDNGLALGQHGLFGKQNHYEHSIRVPLIFAGQGIPQNETREGLVYLLDIYPTICDYLHMDIPSSVEGISMLPQIKEVDKIGREALYFAYTDMMRSVKKDGYKLIEYRNEFDGKEIAETQLFNLKNDPFETINLAKNMDSQSHVEELRKVLFQFRDQWDDRMHPLGEKYWSRYEKGNK